MVREAENFDRVPMGTPAESDEASPVNSELEWKKGSGE
jgi:hypothetical protein